MLEAYEIDVLKVRRSLGIADLLQEFRRRVEIGRSFVDQLRNQFGLLGTAMPDGDVRLAPQKVSDFV
jgi:hypothetical protein